MQTTIYYYSGTGNSLWVARTLAEHLDNAQTRSIVNVDGEIPEEFPACVGLVFPVYMWGVPGRILRFLEAASALLHPEYLFAVAVNGGQVANTLVQLRKVLTGQGKTLAAGWEVTMPSNYIPWGGTEPQEQQRRFEAAQQKVQTIAGLIGQQERRPVESGPLWQRLIYSGLVYPMSSPHIHEMDKKFWVDEKCNHCKICEKICPAGNITLQDGKPVWNQRCEQCFACLQWCPQEAIQYGKKTPQYERYHHPAITLKDMLHGRKVN
jgi:ferredoxin